MALDAAFAIGRFAAKALMGEQPAKTRAAIALTAPEAKTQREADAA